MLPSYADEEYKQDYLYYADPLWAIEICEKLCPKKVTVLKGYSLFEFSIIVSK
jgi:hypothetical protein